MIIFALLSIKGSSVIKMLTPKEERRLNSSYLISKIRIKINKNVFHFCWILIVLSFS